MLAQTDSLSGLWPSCASCGHHAPRSGKGSSAGLGLELDPNASVDTAQASQLRTSNHAVIGQGGGRECFLGEEASIPTLGSQAVSLALEWSLGAAELGRQSRPGALPAKPAQGALVQPAPTLSISGGWYQRRLKLHAGHLLGRPKNSLFQEAEWSWVMGWGGLGEEGPLESLSLLGRGGQCLTQSCRPAVRASLRPSAWLRQVALTSPPGNSEGSPHLYPGSSELAVPVQWTSRTVLSKTCDL